MDAYETATRIVGIFNIFKENSAALAGGCVRDRILGKEPADYDIFIEYEDSRDIKELSNLASKLGWELKAVSGYTGDSSDRVLGVVSLAKEGYKKIDVIFTNWSLEECINAFPSSISQAWEIGGETFTTQAFKETIATKTIVFTSGLEEKHVQKMVEYFPDYTHEFKEK